MVKADDFPDLKLEARTEIARQLNQGTPDANALTRLGYGWSLALEIQRQMDVGGNAGVLFKMGIPARTAKALAAAFDEAFQRRETARLAAAKPGVNAGRKFAARPSYRVPDPSWN